MHTKKDYLYWIFLSVIIIIIDQTTKLLAVKHLYLLNTYYIFPHFNFTLVYNFGAAFSLLNYAGGWQRWFFLFVSLSICIVLFLWLYRCKQKHFTFTTGLTLVLGGALSNLIDRFHYGYVVDFIDLYIGKWHWPVFNFADSMICVGILFLLINSLFAKK